MHVHAKCDKKYTMRFNSYGYFHHLVMAGGTHKVIIVQTQGARNYIKLVPVKGVQTFTFKEEFWLSLQT